MAEVGASRALALWWSGSVPAEYAVVPFARVRKPVMDTHMCTHRSRRMQAVNVVKSNGGARGCPWTRPQWIGHLVGYGSTVRMDPDPRHYGSAPASTIAICTKAYSTVTCSHRILHVSTPTTTCVMRRQRFSVTAPAHMMTCHVRPDIVQYEPNDVTVLSVSALSIRPEVPTRKPSAHP